MLTPFMLLSLKVSKQFEGVQLLGRIAGVVVGLASLAAFPIGTALGFNLLYSLSLRWDGVKG